MDKSRKKNHGSRQSQPNNGRRKTSTLTSNIETVSTANPNITTLIKTTMQTMQQNTDAAFDNRGYLSQSDPPPANQECSIHSLIVLSVVTGLTTLCAILAVMAACYLRKRSRKARKPKDPEANMDADECAIYMGVMQGDSGFSVAGSVENRTYEDVPMDDDGLRFAGNLVVNGIKRDKRSTDKSVRYSLTPDPSMLTDARLQLHGHDDDDDQELQTYEEVNFKSKETVPKLYENLNDAMNGDGEHETESDLESKSDKVTETNKNGKRHKYVSVDYHEDDDTTEETSSAEMLEGTSDETMPDQKSDLQAKTPLYFCVTLSDTQSDDEGDNYESTGATNLNDVRLEDADQITNRKFGDGDHHISNQRARSTYLQSTNLAPKLTNQFLSVAAADGRPRSWSERGTLSTGNTYQQLPMSAPEDKESSVYQKLDRGFLCKTFSHPV
ncbi:uncharacterized protein [Amphiura filiformis]|uniref:uncharacterized protein isoform X2 n=1 Tax=Amphiura filiformis TaxID=82378 RepID=UPI003B2159DD